MRLRRLLFLLLFAAAVATWIAGAGLVMFWDPNAPVEMPTLDGRGNPFFPPGYTAAHSAVSWEGDSEEPPEDAHRDGYVLQRGPLDREAAVFPLSLRYTSNLIGRIEAVVLSVTSDGAWADEGDEADWLTIGRATFRNEGGWCVANVEAAQAPASACGVRVEVTFVDESPAGGFSRSMPAAPTFLGRVHDRIAWLPVFRWLPDLR